MTPKQIVSLIVALFLLVGGLSLTGSLVENVDADEIMVIQSPAGTLSWYMQPGWKWQGFGKITKYQKRSIYTFATKLRFNDGAEGTLHGSIQYELPLNDDLMTQIHTRFGSQEAIQKQLIQTVVDKSIYMTGPLMSSKESYAEKRNALISYVEDQVSRGVYKTRQREERIEDPLTKEKRTITIVEIVTGDKGFPLRQEEAVLAEFGVKTFNFAITELPYDAKIEKQIADQQQAIMDVQTAIANAKKAEQDALTVAKQGEATAAKAKWEQEAIKAKEVTRAEQEKAVAVTQAEKLLEVARLEAAAADQYRLRKIREAEGDATYKREVLKADGALAQKLETYKMVQANWATAFATRKVPGVVFGSNGGNGQDSDVQALLQLLTVKTAKDLSLNMSVPE